MTVQCWQVLQQRRVAKNNTLVRDLTVGTVAEMDDRKAQISCFPSI